MARIIAVVGTLAAWFFVSSCDALSLLSRRHILQASIGSCASSLVSATLPQGACADEGTSATTAAFPPTFRDNDASATRGKLLGAIEAGSNDEAILKLANALVAFDPSKGTGATDPALGGTWRLLWTKDEAPAAAQFARKTLHQPVSTQLLGADAAVALGQDGRVAQLLDIAGLLRFELSSGAAPASDGDASVLEIFPPFRFSVASPTIGSGSKKLTLVEAGSDADFRAVNARSEEAKSAPKNRYAQEYLETSGRAGDLRISRIVEGDTAIVGNVYVHQRMSKKNQ